MRGYCRCLNIEVIICVSESKVQAWADVVAAADESLPPTIDHEAFQGDVWHLTAKTANDVIVRPDDIVTRKKRHQSGCDEHILVHAYLPRLILTRKRTPWRIRECFLCRTPVMAFESDGLNVVCPSNLLGMASDDDLHAIESTPSARNWMLSREAIAPCAGRLSEQLLHSHLARQNLESMSQVWRIAQNQAREEMEQRVEDLRRQELAKYEERLRAAAEVQSQVANSFYSLLSQLDSDPNVFVEALESTKPQPVPKTTIEAATRHEKDRAGDAARSGANVPIAAAASTLPAEDVEVATEALDLVEADVFDDFGGPEPSALGDDPLGRTEDAAHDVSDEEGKDYLSTSAISSSIQAPVGKRANLRDRDDRLPDTTAFNAMTDAERTYAIEKASYQMQDNRLHEIYGDMEPPFLQELRRQAERARVNPAPMTEDPSSSSGPLLS